MHTLWLTLRQTAKLFGAHRKLWLPFLVTACVETVFLGLCWLAPQPPFSRLLAPPIRYFFGERVLHYPWHLWFLYHVMKHTHFVTATVVGAFMSGLACALVQQTHQQQALSIHDALAGKQVRYGTVTLLWLVMWAVANGSIAAIGRFAPKAPWVGWASMGFFFFLQGLLVYVILVAVFERLTWWRALLRGMREFLRYPISTLLIVLPPSMATLLFSFFTSSEHVAKWMARTAPEIAFAFIGARLLMWTLADALLTVAIAHLWWLHRAPQPVSARAVSTASAVTPPKAVRAGLMAILSLVLLGSSTGCSASYNGERLFWKAEELSGPILKDPVHATPVQFAGTTAAYQRVIKDAPGTSWAGRAQLSIGALQLLQKQFREARETYGLVLQNYNNYPSVCLSARVAMAKSYEAEQLWDEAVKAYLDVAEYYPWSPVGLEAPLYVATMFEKRKESAQATKAYEHALYVYDKLVLNAPTPEAANQVKSLQVLAYQRLNRWEDAVAALEVLKAAKQGVNRPVALMTLASIYQVKLNHPEKAQENYALLVHEFPEHPYAKLAKQQLEKLTVGR